MKTILIIEDDRQYREILEQALTKEGYTVLAASNGTEGLKQVQKGIINLILLDIMMPDIDGIGFYYNLTHVQKKHIPIIILTNLSDTAAYGSDIKAVMIKANVSLTEVIKKVKEHI